MKNDNLNKKESVKSSKPRYFCLVKNRTIWTSGSYPPHLWDQEYMERYAKETGSELLISNEKPFVDLPSINEMQEELIVGRTWAQIQAMQRGEK